MKKILLVLCATAFIGSSASALPALQLYIPGATYDFSTETWVIGTGDFELWVIAAHTDTKPLYGVRLTAALQKGASPVDGALTIGGHTYMSSEYYDGNPPPMADSGYMARHGIFPTQYTEFYVGDVLDAPDVVENMQPGESGTAMGKIFKYQVSTTYSWLHFDAYGYYDPYHFKFAPFSHDAEVVPEPATMILLGMGLLGTGLVRRRKK